MKIIRLISVYLLLVSMIFPHTSKAMVPLGPQMAVYGGISNPIGTPGLLHINTSPPEVDSLRNQSQVYNFTGGFGIAYGFLTGTGQGHNPVNDFSVGVDFFSLITTLKGNVYQFGSPALSNFNYQIRLKSTRLMLDGQLNFHPITHWIIPFLTAGIGVSRISASYHDTPVASSGLSGGGISLPSNINWNMAFALGAGVKVPVSQKVQLSLSYLYTDLGPIQTGTGAAPAGGGTVQPVKMRFRDQSALVGMSYSFY